MSTAFEVYSTRPEGGQDIQLWKTRKRTGRRKPWEVRWRVDTLPKSRSFLTSELAENYRSALRAAARRGEYFSPVSGLPESWERATASMFSVVVDYARHAWAQTDSGNSRRTISDNLVRLALAAVDDKAVKATPAPGMPAQLRSALLNWGLSFDVNPGAERAGDRVKPLTGVPEDAAACLAWVESVSRPVADFGTETAALALLDRACVKVRGSGRSAPATCRRRRGILSGLLTYAATRGLINASPLKGVTIRRARSSDAVDRRVVPDWDQAGRLLCAVAESPNPRDRELAAFFTLAYLVGTRPGETRAVREDDITWPEDITDPDAVPGWGLLTVAGTATEVAAAYTDTGTKGETRGLKGRADGDIRQVPVPPEGVAALRDHIATYGVAPDGRLFWYATPTDPHAVVPGKAYRRTWKRARKAALTPAELRAGVAQRPYDLRHGAASYMIGDGVPTPEIARRLGHTVEVLMTVYVHWFKSQENPANRLLEAAFRKRGPLTGQNPPPTANITRITRSAA
ncbi:tyrosine-type recombinase/integrase [Allonocardiopsis opalescens]|uniref:Site-specific recombinase XerC n=1 Tax=Allonocardiopsis opalescens TaxID=1144618 RepID=A0A2T0PZ72_9ACTN|nr:tyrosine-type recombinase/integrase [Allonocardiopsis opalescens]PRX96822.1 site-specific recombinase XerC [Allonocardiopsis opalescens]